MDSPMPSPLVFLAAADPGTRVVVRYRIEGGFTDALGDLVDRTDSSCTIRTRRAEVVVPFAQVVAAKQVPPAPPRRGTPPAGHALP